jgi:hypothetical protein
MDGSIVSDKKHRYGKNSKMRAYYDSVISDFNDDSDESYLAEAYENMLMDQGASSPDDILGTMDYYEYDNGEDIVHIVTDEVGEDDAKRAMVLYSATKDGGSPIYGLSDDEINDVLTDDDKFEEAYKELEDAGIVTEKEYEDEDAINKFIDDNWDYIGPSYDSSDGLGTYHQRV